MKSKEKNSLNVDWKQLWKYVISGILLLVSVLLSAPATGVFRTFPLLMLGGAVVFAAGMSVKYTCVVTAVLTACIYLFSDRTHIEVLIFVLLAIVLFLVGAFAARLLILCKKTENGKIKKKAGVLAAVMLIVSFAVNIVCCGNVCSFLKHDADNTKYISEKYGDEVNIKYTMYDVLKGEYVTYVTFVDGNTVYGEKFDYYICNDYDGIEEHFIESLLDDEEEKLRRIVADENKGFFVVDSKIMTQLPDVKVKDGIDAYREHIGYVLCCDGLIQENGMEEFERVCGEAIAKIKQDGVVFDSLVLCAGNGKEILFACSVTPETTPESIAEYSISYTDYTDEIVSAYGVSEDNILAFWQN